MAEYTPWRCRACGNDQMYHVRQTSKCRGVGHCYYCGTGVTVVREQVSAEDK